MMTISTGFLSDVRLGRGEWCISLFGHLEERETGDREYTVTPIRALIPFRRTSGTRYRVANRAVIFSTKG